LECIFTDLLMTGPVGVERKEGYWYSYWQHCECDNQSEWLYRPLEPHGLEKWDTQLRSHALGKKNSPPHSYTANPHLATLIGDSKVSWFLLLHVSLKTLQWGMKTVTWPKNQSHFNCSSAVVTTLFWDKITFWDKMQAEIDMT
jgi:hypothetical protein